MRVFMSAPCSQIAVSDLSPSGPPSSSVLGKQAIAQYYQNIQQGILELHRVTGIMPPDPVLNGEVRMLGSLPITGGVFGDIWLGLWLEGERVSRPYILLYFDIPAHVICQGRHQTIEL